MKYPKIILAMVLRGFGLKKLSQRIDPNMDLVREASGMKNMLPKVRKFKK